MLIGALKLKADWKLYFFWNLCHCGEVTKLVNQKEIVLMENNLEILTSQQNI